MRFGKPAWLTCGDGGEMAEKAREGERRRAKASDGERRRAKVSDGERRREMEGRVAHLGRLEHPTRLELGT